MRYFLSSIATVSFWRYALLSGPAFARILTATGTIYAFLEILDFFKIYERSQYSRYSIIPILGASIAYAIISRRPITRVSYKMPGKDLCVVVRIGDLIEANGEVVISSSTTFDTDMASGLISPQSLQGQLATTVFQANTKEIDRLIDLSLTGVPCAERPTAPGKKMAYEVGTVAKVPANGNNYYFLAMAELSDQGTASSSLPMIDASLERLWAYIADHGEVRDVSIPLVGTGRGRVQMPRKKMVERIAQSFVDASRQRQFSKRLIIYVHPDDAADFEVNLFEVKDFLVHSLH